MKKFLIALVTGMLAFALESNAQVVSPVQRILLADSLVNTDTANISFNGIGSHVKSIQVAIYKVSGTVAGSVYIQGTVDGVNWDSVSDTLTLSNATVNTKTWKFTTTSYNSYRGHFLASGTMKANITAALLRRGDE